jgi:hypothetical protein
MHTCYLQVGIGHSTQCDTLGIEAREMLRTYSARRLRLDRAACPRVKLARSSCNAAEREKMCRQRVDTCRRLAGEGHRRHTAPQSPCDC